MQIWAESGKSALPICNYSQILYQFLMFTQNLKRSLCALILFRELRDKSRSRLGLAQTRSAIHIVASRYFLFFLPRPFPLADLKAVEYRSTISIKVLNS